MAAKSQISKFVSGISQYGELNHVTHFQIAIYYYTEILEQPVATIADIRQFYKESHLIIPRNFGGETSQLNRKPKKIIKNRDGYGLTQNAKREIILLLSKTNNPTESPEKAFLQKPVTKIDTTKLIVASAVQQIINQRLDEIEKCMAAKAPLACIFLCGSTLEGLLLEYAGKNVADFNRTKVAPKNYNTGKVLPLAEWKLAHLIDAASEVGLVQEDVKSFSGSVKEFRNYIHPNQQVKSNFTPTMHTAEMCYKVLEIAIAQLSEGK